MAPPKVDKTGQRFGRLVIIGRAEKQIDCKGRSITRWRVRCDCGTEKTVRNSDLIKTREPTRSCGCLNRETAAVVGRAARLKHGESHHNISAEYRVWVGMRARCRSESCAAYPDYGGRGIYVCAEWDDPEQGFERFLTDMGRRPTKSHSIDRIDNNGHYEPSNCRWATPKEQAANRKRLA